MRNLTAYFLGIGVALVGVGSAVGNPPLIIFGAIAGLVSTVGYMMAARKEGC